MKIKEVKDQVTDYDVYEKDHPNSPADALQDERKSNIFYTDSCYPDKSMIMGIPKVPKLRRREKQGEIIMTKPIPAEFKTFGIELLNKSKDKLLDKTEADKIANRRSDLIELRNSRPNSAHSLLSGTPEQPELRWSYCKDLFKADSDMKVASSVGEGDAKEKQDSIFSTEFNISITTIDRNSNPSKTESDDSNTSNESITKASKDEVQSEEVYNDEAKRAEPKQITSKHSPLLQREYKKMDLFNNISISHSDLQKSRLVLDDSGSTEEDFCDTSLDTSQKSGMTSNDVVKSLQIDDESISGESKLNKYSPLKNMHETKGIVIPKYLKDVPDEIKELMLDLVKPAKEDSLTFENLMVGKGILTNPSTQSTQILGNLVTSSQVDLKSESCANPERYFCMDNFNTLTTTVTSKMSESGSPRSPNNFPETMSGFNDLESKTRFMYTCTTVEQPSRSEVLVFDHLNPLNNVLLRPINYLETHKYNPMKSDEANSNSIGIHNQVKRDDTSKNVEVRTVTIKQHRVGHHLTKIQDQTQIISSLRSHSKKKEGHAAQTDNITKLKEVLLQDQFRSNSKTYSPSPDKRKQQQSCVEVPPKPISKMQKVSSGPKVQIKVPLAKLATDESSSSSSLISIKDEGLSHSTTPEKDDEKNTDKKAPISKTPDKKSPKSKATKSGQTRIVQKLKADSTGSDTGSKHKNICKKRLLDHANLNLNTKSESFIELTLSDMSFASSNNINPMTDILSTSRMDCQSPHQCMVQGMPSQGNWHPEPPPPEVLVFDYLNSLNNVLLPPINNSKPHKYNPIKSDEKTREFKKRTPENELGFKNSQPVAINLNRASRGARDFEVRTVTVKQHAVAPRLSTTREKKQRRKRRLRLVNINEEVAETKNITKSSEVSLQDRFSSNSNTNLPKDKKEVYRPAIDKRRQQQTSVEMSRKRITKIQKISNNPKFKIKVPVDQTNIDESSPNTEPVKIDKKSTNHSTAAAFDTGYEKYNIIDYEKIFLDDINSILNPKSESLTEFSQPDVLFTLSKNVNPVKEIYSTSNTDSQSPPQSTMQVMHPKVDLNPELICVTRPNQYDSGVNVVAKIDMLPFMGSHECEWRSSSADTWSFRLLHGRLRLTVRLAHRLDNATRTRVRGDTPVLNIVVEALQHDSEEPVAAMCVRFALQTMNHIVLSTLSTKCYANYIPPLLQRCAAVVRVALRWARAIADAKLRLAFTMDSDGNLSLKVANIPLRSIWEVTMRIELVLDDTQSVPWPRASDVRVLPVVSDVVVPDEDLRSALAHTPKDWAHAPSTIWRVFRLLKHKKNTR